MPTSADRSTFTGISWRRLSLRPFFRSRSRLLDLAHHLPAYCWDRSRPIAADSVSLRIRRRILLAVPRRNPNSSQVFERDTEPLTNAMLRKLKFVIDACNLTPGDRVLDVGGGWGAFTEYAGVRGIEVASLTISERSRQFIARLIADKDLPCTVVEQNFLKYSDEKPFDAIVMLCVLEHMPNYQRVIRQFEKLLKPGGYVYIDGSGTRIKYSFNSFLKQYIYPGSHCAISIDDFLSHLKTSSLELLQVINDRRSYYLTAKAWAERDQPVWRGHRTSGRWRLAAGGSRGQWAFGLHGLHPGR